MPELPEVETIRRQLQRTIKGATIKGVTVRYGKKIAPRSSTFVKMLTGKKVLAVDRRAKILWIKLSGGLNLFVHLKMTGRLLLKKKGERPSKHTHVVFELSGGRELHWEDIRKFGWLKLMPDDEAKKFLEKQSFGPEPISKKFTRPVLSLCLRAHPKAAIKPLLMTQSCVAGIGNIYATEALWMAKIHPLTKVEKISDAQIRLLYSSVVSVLKQAIPARGSSTDAYLDIYGKEGAFVPKLKAYGREGKKCLRCRSILKKIRVGGRGTTICTKCQKR
ncbi:bifunctional DNA-formamidopyrimidine glycosylase/DNA-(apurinic or apyrimidinic site) lyase [Patescibacteria group bacterium]|nr:bifunctional DNA-formamidopyrimidine glycosylase/DNA-(apurinic or apyrimidinic site) lyase [Patescibacteria group bacterium]